MPDAALPPWNIVTDAFGSELSAWNDYADETHAWFADLHARLDAGLAPTSEQIRVGGADDPQRLLDGAEWIADTVRRYAGNLERLLSKGDVADALTMALMAGPSGRGFDYRAPSFFHAPCEPGDLRATWQVGQQSSRDALRDAFLLDAPPAWYLAQRRAWSRPLIRALWTYDVGRQRLTDAYTDHLRKTGNPWS